MKEKITRLKAQSSAMPKPLQREISIRLGFALVFLLLFVFVLILLFDWMSTIPFIVISLFFLISAVLLFHRISCGQYVVVEGICEEVSTTLIRKRAKAILVQTSEHLVQVIIKQRLKKISQGSHVKIYVSSQTQVYDRDGRLFLSGYLAIDIQKGSQNDEKSGRVTP